MHVWRMRLQYIFVQITHCKQPLSTSRWFSRKEECSVVTLLSSIMNLQQKSWAVQIKIQFSVSIAWASILIHTNQANYNDLSQGHPKWWFKGTLPPKSPKKISFRNYRIIVFQFTSLSFQVFPCFVCQPWPWRGVTFPKHLETLTFGDNFNQSLQSGYIALEAVKLHPGKVGLRLESLVFTWYDENWKFDIVNVKNTNHPK